MQPSQSLRLQRAIRSRVDDYDYDDDDDDGDDDDYGIKMSKCLQL